MTRRAKFCVIAALLCISSCGDGEKKPSTYSLATGGTAGLYYPLGGAIASIWSEQLSHVNVRAEVTGGSVINVIQVARHESEFGFTMADVITEAYLGHGRFPDPLPLRVLVNTYPNFVHILTLQNSGVTSVTELRGKRVALGAAGSGTSVAAENVLIGLGVKLDEFAPIYLNFAETATALKDGTIDAGFVVGGLGVSAVVEVSVTRDLNLIALSDADVATLAASIPAYSAYDVPAGFYEGVDVVTQGIGIWSAIVVHESMSEKLAFELTCTLFQHNDELLDVSLAARDMTPANLDKIASVPLHSGSARFQQNPESCFE